MRREGALGTFSLHPGDLRRWPSSAVSDPRRGSVPAVRSMRTLVPIAFAVLLFLPACGDAAEEPAPAAQSPAATTQVAERAANRPLLPLPQPEGERAVGARVWEYQIEVTRNEVPAGPVEFHVVNAGTTEHWFIVRDDALFEGTPHLLPGDSAVLRVELEPGEYRLVCTIRDEFDHISEGEVTPFFVR